MRDVNSNVKKVVVEIEGEKRTFVKGTDEYGLETTMSYNYDERVVYIRSKQSKNEDETIEKIITKKLEGVIIPREHHSEEVLVREARSKMEEGKKREIHLMAHISKVERIEI